MRYNGRLRRTEIIEPTPHLVNPPQRLALRREQQGGAVVDDDLHLALVVARYCAV